MQNRFVCIHGHFYQPPRENPWLEEVEVQDSAYPFRDWNERINAECYSPNTASRIKSGDGKIIDIVNNYTKMSFNFGPTLLSWMEKSSPETYEAILRADEESKKMYSGHGSAIAQVYNHMIMPLANKRDKITQVIWGIEDFKFRFKREPEGMWLAETAVDYETLEVLADYGIKFTILAPRQAKAIKKIKDSKWIDVSDGTVNPKRAYICYLPSGKSINLFFYDGPISQELAFGDLLTDGSNLANRLIETFRDEDEPQVAHIATDGETYGHHSKHGDMALAYCLNYIEANHEANITIYGEFLEKFPPAYEAQIIDNTSWSCVHGVERWKNNCGCNSGREGWTQEWRQPLRDALDWLRDKLIPLYEKEMLKFVKDPWKARDEYIQVILNREMSNIEDYLSNHIKKDLKDDEKIRALKLMEMQRHALLMYTSCGWFFDEISGIETVQVIMYAGRAIQLAQELFNEDFEKEFAKRLEDTKSNIPEIQNGAYAYWNYVKPAFIDLFRVTAHYAISTLFEDYVDDTRIFSYEVHNDHFERLQAGRTKLVIGKVRMKSRITYETNNVSYAVLHLGDHNVYGGVRESLGEEAFNKMKNEMEEGFKGLLNVAEVILLLDKHFGTHSYSLWHLFKDESRKVFDKIFENTLHNIEYSFRQIYDNHYHEMLALKEARLPLPKAMLTAVEFTINTEIRKILENPETIDTEKLNRLTEEAYAWQINIDKPTHSYAGSNRINNLMEILSEGENVNDIDLLYEIENSLKALRNLQLDLNLWKAQNIIFNLSKLKLQEYRTKSEKGDKQAQQWLESFKNIENLLGVRIE